MWPPMAKLTELQQQQVDFAAHIRDPDRNPPPVGIEDRRLKIYRELFFNNISKFMASTFRVIRKILEEDRWTALIRDYFAHHKAETPLFPQMPFEFVKYLEAEREAQPDDPPFLFELAHYEWAELALAVKDADPDLDKVNRDGDLLAAVPVISPLAWPLAYTYPVHRIGPDFQPDTPGEQPTFLVVYRGLDDKVGFLEINAVTARLLELLRENDDKQATGRALLEIIAKETGHPQPETVIRGGLEIMQNLRDHDIILGTKKSD